MIVQARRSVRWLILSVISAALVVFAWRILIAPGLNAFDPESGTVISVSGLLSPAVLAGLLMDGPRIVTGFPPLGIFLLLVLGASVAERAGLFDAMVRGGFAYLPNKLLTPATVIIGLLAHQLGDALLAIYLPLAGTAYAARGRNPVLGVLIGFAAFAGAFAANFTPGVPEILLFQFTQSAAQSMAGDWPIDVLGNWYIGLAAAVLYTGATWLISDGWIEPRCFNRAQVPAAISSSAQAINVGLSARERVAVCYAIVAATVASLAFLLLVRAGAPVQDVSSRDVFLLAPFAKALPAGLALILLSAGWAYGASSGTISAPATVRAAMVDGLAGMAPFILAAVVVAFLLSAITLSRLDRVLMLLGTQAMNQADLEPSATLVSLVFLTALADLIVGSATAKWAALAPIVVPMLMSTGISPSMATAAYRFGDGALNIVTPLNPYLAFVLLSCRRWLPDFSLAQMFRALCPFAAVYLFLGAGLVLAWSLAELPPGPTSTFRYVEGP